MCSSHSNSVSRVSGAKTTASSLADSHNHDVAVVGAGIGGLAAAALLARKGARVLVVESHDRPGGSCTSWLRKVRLPDGTLGRFIFDSGVQDFSGLGPGGALRWLLTELGLGSRLTWHRVRHRYHLDDLVIDVPATVERFAQKLEGMFPGDARGLANFFRTISIIYKDLGDHGSGVPGMPQSAAKREQWVARHPVSAQWMQSSFAAMLDAFIADERPRHFLTTLAEYLTDDAASLTVGEMAPLFGYYIDGGFYPQGGSQELANALAEAVKENGGRLRLSARVDRINTDNVRATGITLHDGEIHHCEHVIYNGDVGLLPECLDVGLLPPRFQQRLNSRRLGPSAILVSLGLDRIPAMSARVFVTKKGFTFGIGNPSAVDPTLVPPSCAAVTLLCLLNEKDSAQWFKFDRRTYAAEKDAFSKRLLAIVEEIAPGFAASIVYRQTATPPTFARYLSTKAGNIYGGARRQWKPLDQPILPGLFLAGGGTLPGPGIEAVVLSGIAAAQGIRAER
jgi:all-trans-retinol 13,14-reductase